MGQCRLDPTREYDVLVIGGGNAGLAAALNARRAGATVLILESAPIHFRGGNTRHTRNLRCMHNAPTAVLTEAYLDAEYWADLLKVTAGRTNEALARIVIRDSESCARWMSDVGVRFQPSLTGTLHLSRTNAFFLGGGKALLNAYYREATRLGIEVAYDAEVTALQVSAGRFQAAIVRRNGKYHEIRSRTLVAASGGFESNYEWLTEVWGAAARNFLIRGTAYNCGVVLRSLLAEGAKSIGDPQQCHAVAIDARAPRFDGGIVTRVDCVSLGIVVNRLGSRFYDEGEDFWPKRYAVWGRLVAQQPGQIAYAIIDAKALGKFMPPVFPPIKAHSVAELAVAIGVSQQTLQKTIDEFNQAVQPGTFDHTVLDDCMTQGLPLSKTHWARPLDQPPFYAYPLRPGITFTYLGVTINECSNIIMQDERPAQNMFAAGEIMAGNILGEGYLAGIGITIGTVFGRIAGTEAARRALS